MSNKPSLQWPWIIGVSFVVLALISSAVFLSVAIFAASEAMLGHIPTQAEIAEFSEFFGRVVGPLSSLSITLFATIWLALRVRTAPRLHGLIVGTIVALATLSSDIVLTPPTASDEWVTIVLCVLVGWLGGSWGRFILNNREAIFQTSQAIKGANRQGVVRAIGKHLASPSVVLIALVENSGAVDSSSTWASSPSLNIPSTIGSLPTPPEPATVSTVLNQPWRSTLLIPISAQERLFIASKDRNGFSRTDIQNYLTISGQITLSLENIKLVEQARETGVIQERQRLAGEIHDVLTQGFISIVTQLEMAESKLETSSKEVQPLINHARQTARDNLTAAREMTWALRPDLQQGEPLSSALRSFAQRWSATNDIHVLFTVSGNEQKIHPDLETLLLRTAREALNNIRKHAHAEKAAMTLTYLDTLVALDVQDNGKGFDVDSLPVTELAGGFGLKSIREQAVRLNGELSIESETGKGTTIAVSIPIS